MILAVPHGNANDAQAEVEPYVDGKTVIDVMNALGPNMERNISCTTSTAEETQNKLPSAHVVKLSTPCSHLIRSSQKLQTNN